MISTPDTDKYTFYVCVFADHTVQGSMINGMGIELEIFYTTQMSSKLWTIFSINQTTQAFLYCFDICQWQFNENLSHLTGIAVCGHQRCDQTGHSHRVSTRVGVVPVQLQQVVDGQQDADNVDKYPQEVYDIVAKGTLKLFQIYKLFISDQQLDNKDCGQTDRQSLRLIFIDTG